MNLDKLRYDAEEEHSILAAAEIVAKALHATEDPGMADEADALVVAMREWDLDSYDEYGVESPRDLIRTAIDTLEEYLAGFPSQP